MQSRERVMTISKWSPKGKCLNFFVIFSQLFFKEMHVGKSGEFVCAYLGLEGGGENNSFSLPVILLQIVMVSPGTHLVKNNESQLKKKRNEFDIENALAFM